MQLFLFILVSVSGRSGRRSVQRRTCHALLSVDDLKTAMPTICCRIIRRAHDSKCLFSRGKCFLFLMLFPVVFQRPKLIWIILEHHTYKDEVIFRKKKFLQQTFVLHFAKIESVCIFLLEKKEEYF